MPRRARSSAPRRNPRSPPRSSHPSATLDVSEPANTPGHSMPAWAMLSVFLGVFPRRSPWRFPRDGLFAIAMRNIFAMTAALALLSSPAAAIVGGASPSTEDIGRSVITIVGSRGNFCTGSLIAPTLVLTAAHCVQPGAEYKIVEYDADRKPQLRDVKRVAIHPGFQMQAMLAHRATADVALLQLAMPAKAKSPPRSAFPSSRSLPATSSPLLASA